MKALNGKVALITGAGSGGTGTSMAVRFAAEGAKVAIVARNEAGLQDTAARIREAGGEALVLRCDLGDPAGGRDTLVARTEAAFGPIDIVVNNAVKNDVKRFWEYSLEDMQSDGEVNLWAPMIIIQQATQSMIDGDRPGWILNMSSMGAELPPGPPFNVKLTWQSTLYGAMKSAVNTLTVQGAVEMKPHSICMNTLAPQRSILTTRMHTSEIVKDKSICEPMETMAEAALALCTGDVETRTGKICLSLQLLVELQRPVYDITGTHLLEGWQPADIVKAIQYREDWTQRYLKWPNPYEFKRPQTPYPEVLRRPGRWVGGSANPTFPDTRVK
jgi:NAD(P)-dependent dehydrogenase (short-subunit alcohol dehydrogenase family)